MKNIVFILTGDLAVIHWLSNVSSSSIFFFQKMLVSVMLSFRVIIIISIELLQPSIHAVVMYIFLMLKLAIILFCQHTFFQCVSEYQPRWKKTTYCSSSIFRAASFKLKWEQPLEVATFSQNDFFRIPSYLKQLLFNNYFC